MQPSALSTRERAGAVTKTSARAGGSGQCAPSGDVMCVVPQSGAFLSILAETGRLAGHEVSTSAQACLPGGSSPFRSLYGITLISLVKYLSRTSVWVLRVE